MGTFFYCICWWFLLLHHFTKYIWFYPLHLKYDVFTIFRKYKAMVENKFKRPIVFVYSYDGGEYTALWDFLVAMGVQHLKTLSHTLRHNGTTERRHQHIVYTGLILLQQAKLPHKYCSHAFQTVIYLINRFPTPLLNFSSPYEKLFSKKPNCNKLKVFGCLYFPWLNHTILINFNPNLLLGFFLVTLLIKVHAYFCLDITTQTFYLSSCLVSWNWVPFFHIIFS